MTASANLSSAQIQLMRLARERAALDDQLREEKAAHREEPPRSRGLNRRMRRAQAARQRQSS